VALVSGGAALAEGIAVPSGQPVTLIEVLPDTQPDGLWLRLRFLAPRIADTGADFEASAADMLHLCRAFGLPLLQSDYPGAVRIVVSLSDARLDFGVSDPDATQFFEAFQPLDGDCIWEEF
jgi:hypothetical protein